MFAFWPSAMITAALATCSPRSVIDRPAAEEGTVIVSGTDPTCAAASFGSGGGGVAGPVGVLDQDGAVVAAVVVEDLLPDRGDGAGGGEDAVDQPVPAVWVPSFG